MHSYLFQMHLQYTSAVTVLLGLDRHLGLLVVTCHVDRGTRSRNEYSHLDACDEWRLLGLQVNNNATKSCLICHAII